MSGATVCIQFQSSTGRPTTAATALSTTTVPAAHSAGSFRPRDEIHDEQDRAHLEDGGHAEADAAHRPSAPGRTVDAEREPEHHQLVALADVDGVGERERHEQRPEAEKRGRKARSPRECARSHHHGCDHPDRGEETEPVDRGVVAEREKCCVHECGGRRADEAAEQAVVLRPHLVTDVGDRLGVGGPPVVERTVLDQPAAGGPVDVEVDRHRLACRDRRTPEQREERAEGEERNTTSEEEPAESAAVDRGIERHHAA